MISLINNNNLQLKNGYTFTGKKFPDIPRDVLSQTSFIISGLNSVNPKLQDLATSNAYGVKKALNLIKESTGITSIHDGKLQFRVDETDIEVSAPNSSTLLLRQIQTQNQPEKKLEISYSTVKHAEGFSKDNTSIIDFIAQTLDKLDFPLLQIRKLLRNNNIIQTVIDRLSPQGILKKEDAVTVEDIKRLFAEIHSEIARVQNPTTKTKIKYGYPSIAKKGKRPSEIEFENIDKFGKGYSVNIVTDRKSNPYLVIKVNNNNNPFYYIINSENQVLKEMNLSRVLKIGEHQTYYTQEELNSYSVGMNLSDVKKELEKYKEYLQKSISQYETNKIKYSTGEIGVINPKDLKLITEVRELFSACKAKMLKIKDMPRKKAFKEKYGVDTIMSSPCLIFRDITPLHESIVLSFPVVNGKQCTKIILWGQNDNIKNSLFIEEDKLVKFQAKSIGRSIRKEIKTNYHTQEEIDNSNLSNYLNLVKSRLDAIPKPKTDKQ